MTGLPDDVHTRLATQAVRRAFTAQEQSLAAALERIFTTGEHDFQAVARLLNERNIARPSGSTADWTAEALASELKAINHSLDVAYAEAPAIVGYR